MVPLTADPYRASSALDGGVPKGLQRRFSVSVVESDQGRSGGRLRRRWTRKAKGSARSDCIVMHLWSAGLARGRRRASGEYEAKNNPEWVGDSDRSRGRVGESPHLGRPAYLIRSGLPTSQSLSCSATCRAVAVADPTHCDPGSQVGEPPHRFLAWRRSGSGRPDALKNCVPCSEPGIARVPTERRQSGLDGVWSLEPGPSLDRTRARGPPTGRIHDVRAS